MTKNANKGAAAPEAPVSAPAPATAPAPEPSQAPTAPAAPSATSADPKAETEAVALVKARVLVAGVFGAVDDLVEVTEAEAAASGDLDAHPEAVAYIEREMKKEVRRATFREGHQEEPVA
jgi:hypothetical protein